MVKGIFIIAIFIICAIIGSATIYSSLGPASEVTYIPSDTIARDIIMDDLYLRVIVSYHDDKIYENLAFKVEVLDALTLSTIEGANVSFLRPENYLYTNKEGYVFFSAPYISKVTAPHLRKEYNTTSEDTNFSFPLSITKEGYRDYNKSIVVHIRGK